MHGSWGQSRGDSGEGVEGESLAGLVVEFAKEQSLISPCWKDVSFEALCLVSRACEGVGSSFVRHMGCCVCTGSLCGYCFILMEELTGAAAAFLGGSVFAGLVSEQALGADSWVACKRGVGLVAAGTSRTCYSALFINEIVTNNCFRCENTS